MGQGFPGFLVFGVISIDLAVGTLTCTAFTCVISPDFSCYFITPLVESKFNHAILADRLALLLTVCAVLLGWLASTLLSIYAVNKICEAQQNVRPLYDPYEVAAMTPCLGLVSSILLTITLITETRFAETTYFIIVVVVTVLLFVGACCGQRHFNSPTVERRMSSVKNQYFMHYVETEKFCAAAPGENSSNMEFDRLKFINVSDPSEKSENTAA